MAARCLSRLVAMSLYARVDGAPTSYLMQRLAPFGLDLYEFPGTGWGVRTLHDRPGGERVFSWSNKEVVLAEVVLRRREDLAAAAVHAAEAGRPLTDESLLACYIVAEEREGRDTWFTLYRSTLPAFQPSAISSAGPGDRALLPRCYSCCVKATYDYATKQHAACAAALGAVDEPVPELDRYLRAFAAVRARSFALDEVVFRLGQPSPLVAQRPDGLRRALLPLYDLLNHSSGARTRIERSEGTWRLLSEDSCAAGGQVFNSYGDDRSNLELLLHYGFAVAGNGHAGIGFDVPDLLSALATACPRFGDPRVQDSLRRRLTADETRRRAEALQDLALYSLDASGERVFIGGPGVFASFNSRSFFCIKERFFFFCSFFCFTT
mmetsp:Transcript_15170/g.30263  ORF Transcript_15170/g.30263 Transcript_15170/m.30263 type:complete len:380 (+) Transcript_15170:55-1194(+)